jgi:hypothetical protein
MVLGAGMLVLGVRQSRTARRLRQLDENAPSQLAQNQLLLGILLFLYGAVSLAMVIHSPVSLSSQVGGMDPEVGQMLADYDDLAQSMYMAVYVGVMALAIIVPGLTGLYYHRQRKRIVEYRTSTPAWILSLQNAGVTL